MNDKRYRSEVLWGVPLIAIGVLLLIGNFIYLGNLTGALVTGAIGAAFLWVFYNDRRHWWAIIPGGILVTSAFAMLIGPWGWGRGALHTIGLGVTFLAVWFLTGPENRQHWAVWPGGILLAIGVLQLLGSLHVWGVLWPLILIAIGVYALTRHR